LGRPDEARGYYDQSMELAQKLGFRPEIALIRMQQAELILTPEYSLRPEHPLRHDPEEKSVALDYLDFAIAEFQEMKIQPLLEWAQKINRILIQKSL
jgi:hypothetical protein